MTSEIQALHDKRQHSIKFRGRSVNFSLVNVNFCLLETPKQECSNRLRAGFYSERVNEPIWLPGCVWRCWAMIKDGKTRGKSSSSDGFYLCLWEIWLCGKRCCRYPDIKRGNLFSLIVFQANTETVRRSPTGESKETNGLIVEASPTCEAHLWFKHTQLHLNPFAPKT